MRALIFRLGVAAMLLLACLSANAQTSYVVGWSDVTLNTNTSNYQTLQVATDEEGNTYTLEINTPLPGSSWTVMITDPYGDPIDELDGSGSLPDCRMAVDPYTETVFVVSDVGSGGSTLVGEQADGSRFTNAVTMEPLAIGVDVVHGQVVMMARVGVWKYACSEDGQNGAYSWLDYNLYPWAAAIDPQGNILTIGGTGGIPQYGAKCYDSTGNVTWAQFCNCTPTSTPDFAAVAEDPEGNMYLAIDTGTWNSNTNSNM